VELQEVEGNICKHPKVAVAACAKQGERLVAFVECHPGQTVQGVEVNAFLKTQGCPLFMIPGRIQQLPQVSKNDSWW